MIVHSRAREKSLQGVTGIRTWTVWSIPRSARAFLFAVEALAAAVTVGLLATEQLRLSAVADFGVLIALSVGYAEVGKRSERMRRYLAAGQPAPHPNPLSIWSFAALLVLPVGWAAAFIVVQYAHIIVQRHRERTSKPYRQAFVAAAAIVAQLAAAGVILSGSPGGALGDDLVGNLTVLGAAASFAAVDLGVMLTGMWLTARPPTIRSMLPDGDALSYELVSLALGVAVAELLLHAPWLTPITLAPVAYIHRSSMIKTLREAARMDGKTRLLNTAAWTEQARATLARCARKDRSSAVIIIDIDYFKAINDLRGHLVGDRVLIEVASTLRRELRGHDGIGRFGGDEFVILLDELDCNAAVQVASRLQVALATVRVDDLTAGVSIGMAHSEEHGGTLEGLLAAADEALYAAKAGGRGRLCVARPTQD